MPREKYDALLSALAELKTDRHNNDFLLSWRYGQDTIRSVLLATEALRTLWAEGLSTRVFDTGMAISIFRDQSTRTRYSFRAACNLLGLATEELNEETSQIKHGETVRETAAMLSFCTDVIGIRDDMFIDRGHKYMTEVSSSVQESYDAKILRRRPALINLQCDLDHPTQSLSDLSHLTEYFGGLDALRGKKLAMSWAYSPSYGKPLSVPQGVISLMPRFGMDVVLAHPPGYELMDEPLTAAQRFAKESGGSFSVVNSMEEAFEGADVVYPKSWAPLNVMKRRTELLDAGDHAALGSLEQEALEQNAEHRSWECDEDLMAKTKNGKALYMHCLPADVSGVSCERGEVSESVFDRYRLHTYREASYKPFVIAAMILLTRFEEPSQVLRACMERKTHRSI